MHSLLKKQCVNNTVANTLLFAGPNGSGKKLAALYLAKELMGPDHHHKLESENHPDFRVLYPQGKSGMHPVEAIRHLTQEVALPPYEAPVRIFVIDEAHRMLPTSSNALLKTLEEPSSPTYFILLSSEPKSLLVTILSRCQRFDFTKDIAYDDLHPLLLALLSDVDNPISCRQHRESLESEMDQEENSSKKNELINELFQQLLVWFQDADLLQKEGEAQLVRYKQHLSVLKTFPLHPSEKKLFEALETCQLALQRSMKLSAVLEYFILRCS
jgi:DNA polymerase-3 subunit delta'